MGESEPAGRVSADRAEWSNHMMTQSRCDRAAMLCSNLVRLLYGDWLSQPERDGENME